QATDAAGNSSATSNALAFHDDQRAPNAPTIASFGPDTGVQGDHITAAPALNLSGSAEAGSPRQGSDGATLLGSAPANRRGAWSFTTGQLADGAHSLTATATDAAGNTGAVSLPFNVDVDSTAPNAPVIASFGPDTGVAGDGITNVNVLTLTGSAEANSSV